jgi:hypothetical protein
LGLEPTTLTACPVAENKSKYKSVSLRKVVVSETFITFHFAFACTVSNQSHFKEKITVAVTEWNYIPEILGSRLSWDMTTMAGLT